MDIYLLAGSVTDTAVLKKMQKVDEEVRDPKKIIGGKTTNLVLDEIKEFVTGFARIINYKVVPGASGKADEYELESVVEGEFKNGEMDGYCRAISAINGCCSAGFHEAGKPNGKWSYYRADGTFGLPEGIYEGQKCTQKLQIKTFEQAIKQVKPKMAAA